MAELEQLDDLMTSVSHLKEVTERLISEGERLLVERNTAVAERDEARKMAEYFAVYGDIHNNDGPPKWPWDIVSGLSHRECRDIREKLGYHD